MDLLQLCQMTVEDSDNVRKLAMERISRCNIDEICNMTITYRVIRSTRVAQSRADAINLVDDICQIFAESIKTLRKLFGKLVTLFC
jgi:hypothetical protein